MYTTAFAIRSPSWDEYEKFRSEGRLLEARDLYSGRLETIKSQSPQDTRDLFFALKDLCDVNYDCGDFIGAARYLCEAIRLDKRLCGALVEEHAYPLVRLAYFYVRSHRIAEAELAYSSAMSLIKGGKQPVRLLESTQLHCWSQIQVEKGEHDAATLIEAIRVRREEFALDDCRLAIPYFDLTRLLWRIGNSKAALRCAEKAYWMYESRSRGDTVHFCEFMGLFAMLKMQHGQTNDAKVLFKRSLSKIRKLRPYSHPNRIEIETWASAWQIAVV